MTAPRGGTLIGTAVALMTSTVASAGLTAAYTSLLVKSPKLLWPLIKLAPGALRDLTGDNSLRVSGLQDDFPRELLSANRRGMLAGPRAYFKGRRAARAKTRAERTAGSERA